MVTAELSKCATPSLTTASATARSPVLSISTRLTARSRPASRASAIDADMLGHTTHGLALLAPYRDALVNDRMAKSGEPEVLNRRVATENWDGKRLPGPWLTLRALDRAMAMASACGTGSVAIQRSHHIACLAAYLKRATDKGMIAI